MERAVLFRGNVLLIVVVVTMDFWSQVQAYMMSHQYETPLKKSKLKGPGCRASVRTSMSKEETDSDAG